MFFSYQIIKTGLHLFFHLERWWLRLPCESARRGDWCPCLKTCFPPVWTLWLVTALGSSSGSLLSIFLKTSPSLKMLKQPGELPAEGVYLTCRPRSARGRWSGSLRCWRLSASRAKTVFSELSPGLSTTPETRLDRTGEKVLIPWWGKGDHRHRQSLWRQEGKLEMRNSSLCQVKKSVLWIFTFMKCSFYFCQATIKVFNMFFLPLL